MKEHYETLEQLLEELPIRFSERNADIAIGIADKYSIVLKIAIQKYGSQNFGLWESELIDIKNKLRDSVYKKPNKIMKFNDAMSNLKDNITDLASHIKFNEKLY